MHEYDEARPDAVGRGAPRRRQAADRYAEIVGLQRRVGNAAVTRFLGALPPAVAVQRQNWRRATPRGGGRPGVTIGGGQRAWEAAAVDTYNRGVRVNPLPPEERSDIEKRKTQIKNAYYHLTTLGGPRPTWWEYVRQRIGAPTVEEAQRRWKADDLDGTAGVYGDATAGVYGDATAGVSGEAAAPYM